MSIPVPADVRALLFDCDGTLVDSMPLHWRAWIESLRALVPRKQARFRELLPGVSEIKPVADVVRAFAGRLPMAIVSGGCRRNVTASLQATGLISYFPVILTSDDPFPGKPAPDIMLEAARRLGVAPAHCLVFEDGELGLTSARMAGMQATDVCPWLGTTAAGCD